jgi:hypothetical protein
MDDYQAESDFHTLIRAAEVRMDKERHAKAMEHGRRQRRAIGHALRGSRASGEAPEHKQGFRKL